MSEPSLDAELVQDYLAECREHLATIETDLLTIEQGGAEIDEELVNQVFRAAHSIKGGAGFFDLVKIRELAHKTESALDLIRSRQMVPTPEIVSILLLAFDKLRELIQNHGQSNQADIGEFVNALTALTADHLTEDQKQSLTQQAVVCVTDASRQIGMSAFDLNQARRGGKSIYLIQYDLIHDIQRQGKTPWQVFKGLIQYGSILETTIDLDSAGTLDDEPANKLMLEVLFASVLEPDLIGQVGVSLERVRVIEKNGELRPLASPAPPPPMKPKVKRTAKAKAKPAAAAAPAPALVAPAPPSPPAPALPEAAAKGPAPQPAPVAPAETTIRLNVTLLDSLMTLAGELVLSRNQLNESLSRSDERGIRSGAQRVSLVTSELQEVVTQTRMQPVGSLFAKFPRLVRDLSRDLGKDIQLRLEGSEVEIDKSILEGLSDPLTHMIRNAVDHGIELPAERTAAGKTPGGMITLRASHQAGQVVIEISDDGKGLAGEKIAASSLAKGMITREQLQTMSDREKMALIFLPGVSTAEKLSDVSGRGVGMDVVKTNLDRLGGKIEIDSTPGKGSSFRIKLPLTLAIIPSLLVSDGGQRFAIPQVSVGELIRIPWGQIAQRTDKVGDAQVLNLRDRMVPLVYLADALGAPRPQTVQRALNVVLVDTGAFEYGLVVEELHDTVEIVVKPLGRHLKGIPDYAGATILGDGRVAVILDVAGLAARVALTAGTAEAISRQGREETVAGDRHSLLLFHNTPGEVCAVPIEQVTRIERVRASQIEYLGGRRTMQYRGATLPVVTLHDAATVGELTEEQRWVVIVFESMGLPLGLLAAEPLDMVETTLAIDTETLRQRGVAGSAVLKDRTILILDISGLAEAARPEWAQQRTPSSVPAQASGDGPTVLVADDSDFFRSQIQRLAETVGCRVLAAEDGQMAWELLDQHAGEVDLVATDVEMPRMDGLALTRQIRADSRFIGLPIIALSSLAGEEEIARGMAAGVTEYQIKLNKDEFTQSIRKAVQSSAHRPASANKGK
jgi:two-component system chemotaxis sensor kinase CheA